MNAEEISDFCEDVSEGDLVTLLLNDDSQETGIIKKIRNTNIKIETVDVSPSVLLTILFSDVRRYALGNYNFIRKSDNINTTANSYQSINEKEILLIKEKVETEIKYVNTPKQILPNFSPSIKSTSYIDKKTIKQFISTAKNKYDTAIKLQELSRIQSFILNIDEILKKYPQESCLYSIKGIFLWSLNKKDDAIKEFQQAAFLSHKADDWMNLALSASDTFLKVYAFKKAFEMAPGDISSEMLAFFFKHAQLGGILFEAAPVLCKLLTLSTHQELARRYTIFLLLSYEKSDDASRILSEQNLNSDAVASTLHALYQDCCTQHTAYTNWKNKIEHERNENIFYENARVVYKPDIQKQSLHTQNSDKVYPYLSKNIRGIITSCQQQEIYGKTTFAGYIQGENNNEYFFIIDHVEDESLTNEIINKDFSSPVQFSSFINKTGRLQAGHIKRYQPAVTGTLPKSERYINDLALLKISSDDRDAALAILQDGIKTFPNSKQLYLLLAQQLSALGRSQEAADAYAKLMTMENRGTARKNAHIQYALLLGKAGEQKKAKKEVAKLLALYPTDAFLKTLSDKIQQYAIEKEYMADVVPSDEALDIWEENNTMAVPRLLKKELEYADFYDEQIVSRGGKPSPEDAERLKKEAFTSEKDSQERYFLFLEAAKAYSMLPAGTFVYDDYKDCLSRYATQKGAVLINRMNGLASSPQLAQKNTELLSSLSDSAICYFIEGLSLLSPDSVKVVGASIIRNFLRCLLFKFFSQSPEAYDSTLLNSSSSVMLTRMLSPDNRELFTLVCQAVLTWGSYPDVWTRLMRVPNGPGLFTGKLQNPAFRKIIKETFTSLTGHRVETETPRDFLKGYFFFLKNERDSLDESFRRLQRLTNSRSFDYFRRLQQELEKFPLDNRALQASDKRMLKRLITVINNMMSYREATDQERTDILVRARQGVKDKNSGQELIPGFNTLQKDIVDMPTYWQLVGCEGIIQQCLLAVDNMEQLRTKLRQPQLNFSLEPPVFQQNNNTDIRTTLLIKNDGVVSANNLLINICVTSAVNNSTVIFKKETHLDRISQKSTSKNIDIIIPLRSFQSISLEATQLTIHASYAEGKTDPAKFTIDIDKGSHFTREMIPWSFAGKVQQEAFKGREEIIKELEDALNDKTRRAFSYMLYGVTRSGKTSILNFLRQRIHGKKLRGDNTQRCFFCIQWEFSSASNCSTPNALWTEFLHSSIQRAIEDWNVSEELRSAVHHILPDPQNVQGEHFRPLMEALKKLNVYPVILIDEFTFYRNLHDNGFLGPSFLSLIREFALNDYATFIMAGTYDLLDIIKDEHYGITGQFVNLVKKQVTNIKKQPAKELVNIFEKHLKFTDESCNYILHLADCRPYLIQMICYYCAQYALHLRRSILGMPEVEHVVAILCGESDEEQDIHALESSRFDNNLIFAKEKQYPLFAAVTTIISHSGNQKNGFISYNRLRTIWRDNALNASDLASVLDDLVERQVIENIEDEGDMGYRLRVELFRRWWHKFHPHLEKEIDAAQAYSSI